MLANREYVHLCPIVSIANQILDMANVQANTLDPLQLQKLSYLAHGWNLAFRGRLLVSDGFESMAVRAFKPDVCTKRSKSIALVSIHETYGCVGVPGASPSLSITPAGNQLLHLSLRMLELALPHNGPLIRHRLRPHRAPPPRIKDRRLQPPPRHRRVPQCNRQRKPRHYPPVPQSLL